MSGPLLAATGTTLAKIQAALEVEGIEFLEHSGVRRRR